MLPSRLRYHDHNRQQALQALSSTTAEDNAGGTEQDDDDVKPKRQQFDLQISLTLSVNEDTLESLLVEETGEVKKKLTFLVAFVFSWNSITFDERTPAIVSYYLFSNDSVVV